MASLHGESEVSPRAHRRTWRESLMSSLSPGCTSRTLGTEDSQTCCKSVNLGILTASPVLQSEVSAHRVMGMTLGSTCHGQRGHTTHLGWSVTSWAAGSIRVLYHRGSASSPPVSFRPPLSTLSQGSALIPLISQSTNTHQVLGLRGT